MMNRFSLLTSCLFTFTSLFSSELLFDRYFSPYAGSEDLLTIQKAIERGEDVLYKKKDENPLDLSDDEDEVLSQTLMSKYKRLGNQVLIMLPINVLSTTVQHEVFGHGYRIRQIGSQNAAVTGFSFDSPPPYGPGGAATYYNFTDSLTVRQQIAISIAGLEATAILANRVKLHWLQEGQLDARQTSLYNSSQQDILWYILLTNESDYSKKDGNDIASYVYWMDIYYPTDLTHIRTLRKQVLVNLLDPFTWYSYYSFFNYIWTGKNGSIPMIPVFGTKYLPGFRYALSPSGPETYFENFFLKDSVPFYAYLKYGYHAGHSHYGFGFEHPALFDWIFSELGLRVDFWKELKAVTAMSAIDFVDGPNESVISEYDGVESRFGAAFSFIARQKIEKFPGSIFIQAGYKSVGYLPGESLNASPILRAGLDFKF